MQIYLVRHARPEGVEGRCYGRRDVPASRQQTVRAAWKLHKQLPPDVLKHAPIYSSPSSRCAALAHALAPGRKVFLTPELLELDFHRWEGSAWDAVPRGELDAWAQDPWRYAPGGGESAESASRRFWAWAHRLAEEAHAAVIAVTHAGLMRVALSQGSDDPAGLGQSIAYASAHCVRVERLSVRGDHERGIIR